MRNFHNWLSLSATEKRLCLKLFVMMMAIRFSLWWIPFRKVHGRVLDCCRPATGAPKVALAPIRIAKLVRAVAPFVPRATCLTQAMAAQIVLAQWGFEPKLCFGGKRVGDKLKAHAWVEVDGEIVIGKASPGEFSDFREAEST